MRASRLLTSVAIAVVLGACGGGSDADDVQAADPEAELRTYCSRAEAYLEATESIDPTGPKSIIDGLAKAAVAGRAAADVAPSEIRDAQEKLAAAGEDLAKELQARNPQTLDDLEKANSEVTTELTAKYGDLEEQAQLVEDFGRESCGLTYDD